jgi:hypothetical protein
MYHYLQNTTVLNNNSPLSYCNCLSMNYLQIAMCFHQQTDYQYHSIYLLSNTNHKHLKMCYLYDFVSLLGLSLSK